MEKIKMPEEKFLKIKNRLMTDIQQFIDSIQDEYEELSKNMDSNETEELLLNKYFIPYLEKNYYSIINFINQFDLSDIPYEAWEDFPCYSFGDYVFDLSETSANIDFSIMELSYCKNYNFRGCNYRNLDKCLNLQLNGFDDVTIHNNYDIFLDDDFPLSFKEKYYNRQVSIEDFINLEEKLRDKYPNNFEHFYSANYYKKYGSIDRINRLLKKWPEEISFLLRHSLDIKNGTNLFFFVEKIENIPDEEVVNEMFSYLRNVIVNEYHNIKLEELPKKFVEENKDILLLDIDIPDDIKEKYYSSDMRFVDILKYPILLKYAQKNPSLCINDIDLKELLDYQELGDIIINRQSFLKYLCDNYRDYYAWNIKNAMSNNEDLSDYLERQKDRNNNYLHYYLLYNHLTDNNDYSNMSLEEILQLRDRRCEKENKILDDLIEKVGYDNIIKFQKETGIFTQEKFGNVLYNLEFLCSKMMVQGKGFKYGSRNYYDSDHKINYQEFKNDMISFFIELRTTDYLFDYRNCSLEFQKNHPDIFLSEEDLSLFDEKERIIIQDLFYQKKMQFSDIKKYPILVEILKSKNLAIPFGGEYNAMFATKTPYFLELCREYGNNIKYLRYSSIDYSKYSYDELSKLLNSLVFDNIKIGNITDYRDLPLSFQKEYPFLFLPENVDEELKDKYYRKKLTIDELLDNPNLVNYFTSIGVDIIGGLPSLYSKLIHLKDDGNTIEDNIKLLKIAKDYGNILNDDGEMQNEYISIIKERFDSIDDELLKTFREVLFRLLYSNSSKLTRLRSELIVPITKCENPLEKLEKIEDLYLKNHLPDVMKTYQVFRILHSDKAGNLVLNTRHNSSPVLLGHSARSSEFIISSDLIKIAMESNNISIRNYISSIKDGYLLYHDYKENSFSSLDEEKRKENIEKLRYFSHMLYVIYNESYIGKKNPIELSGDLIKDIENAILALSPNQSIDYDLTDRITKMFVSFAGFNNYHELLEHMNKVRDMANKRNQERVNKEFVLHRGDLIKGINDLKYLSPSLSNGIVATEFLGSSASKSGDCTPFDTDFSYVNDEEISLDAGIDKSISRGYGPIWLVIENGDKDLYVSRNKDGEEVSRHFEKDKIELFETEGSGHFGIRTGIGSTHISYIVTDKYYPNLGLDIAMQGFYIPIVNRSGKVLFSVKDYEDIRNQMEGLSHYGCFEYNFSNHLENPDIMKIYHDMKKSDYKVRHDEAIIKERFRNALQQVNIGEQVASFKVKEGIDGDLSTGVIEILDTGSTGRGTNTPGDSDYDFIIRIDSSLYSDSTLRNPIVKSIGEALHIISLDNEIRAKEVKIEGIDTPVDIDIGISPKKDDITYSTDMCLKDRLDTIMKIDPVKYDLVRANIIYAKKVLKEGDCYYKRGHSKYTGCGGLGGVGVENFILQHGGSYIDAMNHFMNAAMNDEKNGYVDWNTFKSRFHVWDFGENFHGNNNYHDDFVYDNMDKDGYTQMIEVFSKELEKIRKREEMDSMMIDMDSEPVKTECKEMYH